MNRTRFAAVALSLLIAASSPCAALTGVATRIGVAGGVRGTVKAIVPGDKPVGRVLSSGQPLYLGERITTGPDSTLQVMLLDETIFTIGPNSAMTLDEFAYNPKNQAGKVVARITKGFFRFVTGQIGHNKPESVRLRFPTGVMAVRGTIIAGQVSDFATTAILLGPGPAHSAPGERIGAFRMENAGQAVDVVKPGFGTTVEGAKPPTPPTLVPPSQLNVILGATAHRPDRADGPPRGDRAENKPGDPADGQAYASRRPGDGPDKDGPGRPPRPGEPGERGPDGKPGPDGRRTGPDGRPPMMDPKGGPEGPRFAAPRPGMGPDGMPPMLMMPWEMALKGDGSSIENLRSMDYLFRHSFAYRDAMEKAAYEIGDNQTSGTYGISRTTWDQLRGITTGTGYYSGSGDFRMGTCQGGSCAGPTGSVNFTVHVDFGARTIGGSGSQGSSRVTFTTNDTALAGAISETVTFGAVSYGGFSGGEVAITGVSSSGKTNAHFAVGNVNAIADQAKVDVSYKDDGAQNYGAGFATGGLVCEGTCK